MKRLLALLVSFSMAYVNSYADNTDASMQDMMKLLSKGLSKKQVMPVNIQLLEKDNYLLFQRNAPLNRITVHYGSEETKKIATNCIGRPISSNGLSKEIDILNNVEMFKITKIYKDNNKYIVVGYEQNMSSYSTHQAAIMAVDQNGKTLWKTIVGTGKSYSEAMVQASSNGYMIVGHDFIWQSADKSRGNYHVMVAKVNQKGKKVWTKHYSLDGSFAKGRNIEKTNDGGFIIVGETHSKAWVFKIDASGNKVWETFFDTPKTLDFAYAVHNNLQNGYIILGTSNGSGFGDDKSWIMKVNYSGKTEWSKYFEIGKPCDLQTVNQIQPDEFVVTGFLPWSKSIFFMNIDVDGGIVSENIIKLEQ